MAKKDQYGFNFTNSLIEPGSGTTNPDNGTVDPQQVSISRSNHAKEANESGTNDPVLQKLGHPVSTTQNFFGMDWGGENKCYVNGIESNDMEQWIIDHPGSTLCVEENFHSWCPELHNEIIDRATEYKVTLKCIDTRAVKNYRKDYNSKNKIENQIKKSDAEDSSLLYVMYIERPSAFVKPRKLPNTSKTKNPADRELVIARRAEYARDNIYIQKWTPYVNLIATQLYDLTIDNKMEPKDVNRARWAINLLKTSKCLKWSTVAYILHSKNRREFDNYWCARRNRGIGTSNFYRHALIGENNYEERKWKMQSWRRAVRRLYVLVKRKQKLEIQP